MSKYIVRSEDGEFVTCVVGNNLEEAHDALIERGMVFDNYTLELEPKVELFQSNDWLEDFNSPMSRHHY